MPRPRDKYEREHQRRIEEIQRRIDAIYAEAIKEAAAIGVTIDMPADVEKVFSFDDYPLTEKRVEELLESLRKQLHTAIVNSVRSSWTLANNKNNELCNVVFGSNVGKLTQEQYRRYYSTNDKALDAFIQRKENGMNLSDRVWHYSDLFKNEIEMGLDLGIREGKDAASMARDLKQYLQHPDKLFRRVRDEHGNLHLSKAAADFHPGRGVYRSSYMNARRLAATETNIAYRTADHERMKNLDFVVGIEIHLSHNHTCKGREGKPHPFTDICNELEGKYPKDFKFTGWHPHCRCYVTSVLKTDEEIAEDTKKILRGEEVTGESENTVENVPEGYKKWVEKNEERIKEAKKKGTLPYFVRDNEEMVSGGDELQGSPIKNGLKSMINHLTFKEDALAEQQATAFTKAQIENHKEVSRAIQIEQGERMTFKNADSGKSNPNFSWFSSFTGENTEYNINCTLTVATHEMRMRGWNVTAKAFDAKNKTMAKMRNGAFNEIWIDPKTGRAPEIQKVWAKTIEKTAARFEKATEQVGRYHISVKWQGGYGHVFCVDRLPNGSLRVYDPQNNQLNITDWMKDINLGKGIGVLKVDGMLINPSAIKQVVDSYQS